MGSDFLFVTPSWSRGVASIVDLWGVLSQRNVSPTPQYADALAMLMDWRVTGNDIAVAAERVLRDPAQMTLFGESQLVAR
jgi:hypothetical protein